MNATRSLSISRKSLQLHILKPFAQDFLVEFSYTRFRYFLDEDNFVGQPPRRQMRAQGFENLFFGNEVSEFRFGHDASQRPLLPAIVSDCNDGSLENFRMRHDPVLQRHRGDPLAARFYKVFGAVHDLHKTVLIDSHDISGVQPAVCELLPFVITVRHPRTTDAKLAGLPAIPGDFAVLPVDDTHLQSRDQAALLGPLPQSVFFAPIFHGSRQAADRGQWGNLGHPPSLDNRNAELSLISRNQTLGNGGAA